jgi:hypothetical protein
VQAVVAAVTAVSKANEPPEVRVPQVADNLGMATDQQVDMSVAAPNAILQQPILTG